MAVSDAAGQLLWVCGTPAGAAHGREHRLRRGPQLGRAARRHQRARHGAGARPAGERDRRGALPPVGAALELRGDPDPRPGRRRRCSASSTSPAATRSSCRRRWRWSAPPPGWPSPSWPAALLTAPARARATPPPGARVCARGAGPHRGAARPSTTGRGRGSHAAAAARGTARSCCCSPPHRGGCPATSSPCCSTRRTTTASTLRAELNRLRDLLGEDAAGVAPLPARRGGHRRLARRRGAAGRRRRGAARCAPTAGRCCRARPRRASSGSARRSSATLRRGGAPLRRARPDVDLDPVVVGRATTTRCGSPSATPSSTRSPLLPLVAGQIARLDRELGL